MAERKYEAKEILKARAPKLYKLSTMSDARIQKMSDQEITQAIKNMRQGLRDSMRSIERSVAKGAGDFEDTNYYDLEFELQKSLEAKTREEREESIRTMGRVLQSPYRNMKLAKMYEEEQGKNYPVLKGLSKSERDVVYKHAGGIFGTLTDEDIEKYGSDQIINITWQLLQMGYTAEDLDTASYNDLKWLIDSYLEESAGFEYSQALGL